MKTSIKTLIALLMGCSILVNVESAKAATVNTYMTSLSGIKNINKIVVSGNVKLILVQDGKSGNASIRESVGVYDNYYGKNALVQMQGDVLRISSFEKQPLAVVVHVNNLNAVEAFNNSTVKTEGKFQLINLDVTLHDQASADINANTVSMHTSVNDQSSLKLSGTTDSHTVLLSDLAKLAMADFKAQDTDITTKSSKMAFSMPASNKFELADFAVIRK